MMINSISTNSYINYGNYSTQNNQSTEISSDNKLPKSDGSGRGMHRGEGRRAKQMERPNVDLDENNSWSLSELDEYSTYSSEVLEINIDTEKIMSTYDADEDGSISSSEREALRNNNAFNLPSPKEIMMQMGHQNRPTIKNSSESNENIDSESLTDFEDFTNSYAFNKLLETYTEFHMIEITWF